MDMYGGVVVYLHRFLTPAQGIEWSSSYSGHSHRPGKEPRFLLDRRPGGPQSRSERGGKDKKNSLSPCRESNADGLARSLITILTELSRLGGREGETVKCL
jgi:hypothetical protein